jgi:hypothetical protein
MIRTIKQVALEMIRGPQDALEKAQATSIQISSEIEAASARISIERAT